MSDYVSNESPLTAFPPPPPSPPARKPNAFFFGRFGLRAGYGIAIFIACWLLFTVIGSVFAVLATGKMHELVAAQMQAASHPGAPKPKVSLPFQPALVIVSDGVTFAGMLALCWLMGRAERRPLGNYGIGSSRVRDVVPGAICGLLILSALVGLLYKLHFIVFDSLALHGPAIFFYGLKWLIAFTLVGFAEEYAFRGYVQYTLMRGVWGLAEKISPANTQAVAFWIAAIILSFSFGAVHLGNKGETLFGVSQVVAIGLVFAYALWRTGSLWWAIGFHATWDWAQSFLFGVADSGNVSIGRLFVTHAQGRPLLSGGSDGPEGSIFVFAAEVLTIIAIHVTTRPGAYAGPEQLPREANR